MDDRKEHIAYTKSLSGGDVSFAEIEYEPDYSRSTAAVQALRFYSGNRDMSLRDRVATAPQPIEQRARDPIREKFYDMRRLASDRPFARNDSELFYKQAKFMEDFTDDYEGDAKFSMYYPFYQHMGYDQLRTYFTWRSKVRRGEILQTSVSYAFLYVYELLSGIGADDPADGLNKLVSIWDNFLRYGLALENYLPKWLKDYHIFYELPHSFTDFVKEHGLQEYYSLAMAFECEPEDSFDVWNSISAYNAKQSRFYKDGNEQTFREIFSAVISRIDEFCANRGESFHELFIYKMGRRSSWNPFSQALFYSGSRQTDRQVMMPGKERYYCKNNVWSANLPIYYSSHKDYAGYILKKTEACAREALKYKYHLTAELKVRDRYSKEPALTGAELEIVIEKAVEDYFREKSRTVVTVNHANLARIREEALGTQEALAVPDSDDNVKSKMPNTEFWNKSRAIEPDLDDDRVDPMENSCENSEISGAVFATQEHLPELSGQGLVTQEHLPELSGQENDDWQAYKEALTTTELEALSLVLQGGADLKAFADENGVMLEVLVDSINEKASDFIGDSIMEIDGEINIFDEYRDSITGIARSNSLRHRGRIG